MSVEMALEFVQKLNEYKKKNKQTNKQKKRENQNVGKILSVQLWRVLLVSPMRSAKNNQFAYGCFNSILYQTE